MNFEDYKSWVYTRVNIERSPLAPSSVGIPGQYEAAMTALAAMGLSGETGEVVDLLKKNLFHGKPMTHEVREKLILEMGDMLWYFALLCYLLNVPLDTIIARNISKLTARDGVHGEKFFESRNAPAPHS